MNRHWHRFTIVFELGFILSYPVGCCPICKSILKFTNYQSLDSKPHSANLIVSKILCTDFYCTDA